MFYGTFNTVTADTNVITAICDASQSQMIRRRGEMRFSRFVKEKKGKMKRMTSGEKGGARENDRKKEERCVERNDQQLFVTHVASDKNTDPIKCRMAKLP